MSHTPDKQAESVTATSNQPPKRLINPTLGGSIIVSLPVIFGIATMTYMDADRFAHNSMNDGNVAAANFWMDIKQPDQNHLFWIALDAAEQGEFETFERCIDDYVLEEGISYMNFLRRVSQADAYTEGHKQIVEKLLELGLDPNEGDALTMIAQSGHAELVSYLYDHGGVTSMSVINGAFQGKDLDTINIVLSQDFDFNAENGPDDYGRDPVTAIVLEVSVHHDDHPHLWDVLDKVLENDIDPDVLAKAFVDGFINVRDNMSYGDQLRLLDKLVAAGANLNYDDGTIISALLENNNKLWRDVIDLGADPFIGEGKTIFAAVKGNNVEYLEDLVDNRGLVVTPKLAAIASTHIPEMNDAARYLIHQLPGEIIELRTGSNPPQAVPGRQPG